MRRGLAIVLVALASACAGGGDDEASELPRCDALAGTKVADGAGDLGCLTEDGSALQSYRYQCHGYSPLIGRQGEHASPLPEPVDVAFIPDAGLVGVDGRDWEQRESVLAFHRTPFALLQGDRCARLESVPQDWPIRVGCDLDETPADFVTLQGCQTDGTYHRAVGRVCTYFDYDINATWEQWWIEGYDANSVLVIETDGPGDRWALTPDAHRDDRCATNPNEWLPEWSA